MASQQIESPTKRLKRLNRVPTRASAIIDQVNADADAPVQWPPIIRDALGVLTFKQRRFVIGIAAGLPKIKAYKQAYDVAEDTSDESIAPQVSTVLHNHKVIEAKDLILDWVDRDWLFDAKDACEVHLLRLDEESRNATKTSDRIAASVAILKAHGAFVSRSEVRHIHALDSDSTKGIVAELASLLGTPEPKTPKQLTQADVASVEFTEPETSDS